MTVSIIDSIVIKFNKLKKSLRRKYFKETLDKRIFIFCHHKSGTKLLDLIFSDLSYLFGWDYIFLSGYRDNIPGNIEIILFSHSLVSPSILKSDYNGLHVIRDPRDIIISGYLYHKRTNEKWCINKNHRIDTPFIGPPLVPKSQEHRSEIWKKSYLVSLNSISYQDNLNMVNQDEGIDFEMDRYASWTINAINDWNYNNPNILEVKFEDIISNYKNTIIDICKHFSFSDRQISKALKVSQRHDISKFTDESIINNQHIYSHKVTCKWKDFMTESHKNKFKNMFGDVLIKLGYEKSNNW